MRIEPLTAEDIEFELAEMEPTDWDFMRGRIHWHLSTPYAVAIKSVWGEALVSGMGLGIAHNGSGWLGDRLMHPRFRGDELEALLAKALMERLRARGCESIMVLATEAQQDMYAALGFTVQGAYVHYADGKCEAPTLDDVVLFEPQHSVGLLHMDKLASGEDRLALMTEHFYASRLFVSKGRVLGTYMPLLGEGSIVAANEYAGLELLRWHLPHVTSVWLPETNTAAVQFLLDRKYQLRGRMLRMVYGAPVAWKPEMQYGWLGRNLG